MLYHPKIGFPDTLEIPTATMQLHYTKHALERQYTAYIKIDLPAQIVVDKKNVVEVETKDDITPIKIVLRTKYDAKNDLILVMQPDYKTNTAKVITLWTNDFRDNHRTLNKEYDRPKKRSL